MNMSRFSSHQLNFLLRQTNALDNPNYSVYKCNRLDTKDGFSTGITRLVNSQTLLTDRRRCALG